MLAWLVDVLVIQQLALVGMLVVGIWSILGHRLAGVLAFPLFFLFFAVPMGEGLIDPMMDFTAVSTVWLIQLSGIPVFREGLFFTLPTGKWSIVEACSGVRYIIASVTVGALFAYLTYVSWWRRALFLLISAIVPVFANTMRAYIIVMLGHFSDMKIATGADHLVYGWVFFGVVIFILFWLGSFFREEAETAEQFKSDSAPDNKPPASRNTVVLAFGLALLAAAAIPLTARYAGVGTGVSVPSELVMPGAAGDWVTAGQAEWEWQPIATVSGVRRAFYSNDESVVGIEIQFAGRDDTGEVVGSNRLLAAYESPWKIFERDSVAIRSAGAEVVIDEATVRGNGEELLVWSWYMLGDVQTANDYVGKVQQAAASLGLSQPGASRVVLVTPLSTSRENTRPRLQAFLDAHGSELLGNLQQAFTAGP